MKKSRFIAFCMALVVGALAYTAIADGNVRAIKTLPDLAHGTNAVVTVKFDKTRAIEPVAFDISGDTVSSGTVEAYLIRYLAGVPVTNVIASAATPAETNAFSSVTFRTFAYGGEPIYFKFSLANGGALTVYGASKE